MHALKISSQDMTSEQNHHQLSELIDEVGAIARDAQTRFGALTARQLNWKPSAEQWSIGQCLDHLITANRFYFPLVKEISAGTKKPTLWERMPLLPDFFGKMMIKSMNPAATRKIRAPRKFRPSSSDLDARTVESFVAHQQELATLMSGTAHLDLRRIVITSPVSRLVTYSLRDAYELIVVHEKRHLQQARRVKEMSAFPGAQ